MQQLTFLFGNPILIKRIALSFPSSHFQTIICLLPYLPPPSKEPETTDDTEPTASYSVLLIAFYAHPSEAATESFDWLDGHKRINRCGWWGGGGQRFDTPQHLHTQTSLTSRSHFAAQHSLAKSKTDRVISLLFETKLSSYVQQRNKLLQSVTVNFICQSVAVDDSN